MLVFHEHNVHITLVVEPLPIVRIECECGWAITTPVEDVDNAATLGEQHEAIANLRDLQQGDIWNQLCVIGYEAEEATALVYKNQALIDLNVLALANWLQDDADGELVEPANPERMAEIIDNLEQDEMQTTWYITFGTIPHPTLAQDICNPDGYVRVTGSADEFVVRAFVFFITKGVWSRTCNSFDDLRADRYFPAGESAHWQIPDGWTPAP